LPEEVTTLGDFQINSQLSSEDMNSQFIKMISRLFILTIFVCVGLPLALATYKIVNRTQSHKYTIAAGMEKGESYLFSLAMADLIANYQPKIKIQVIPSDGSEENIQLLQDNKAQLATAQADIPVQSSTRIVTFLFPDVFQLVVKDTSNIKKSQIFGAIGLPDHQGKAVKLSLSRFWLNTMALSLVTSFMLT
jgi:hypothetical protein